MFPLQIITLDQQRGSLKMVVQYGMDSFSLEQIVEREIALHRTSHYWFYLAASSAQFFK